MAGDDPTWDSDGFVILPRWLTPADLAPALGELWMVFPTAEEFHHDVDPERNARFRDEFGGITNFAFDSTELSLLAVHPRLIDPSPGLPEPHGAGARPGPSGSPGGDVRVPQRRGG